MSLIKIAGENLKVAKLQIIENHLLQGYNYTYHHFKIKFKHKNVKGGQHTCFVFTNVSFRWI